MAIKTFTAGETLTAADTNTYLANSGLVFIKSQTITGTPTSVTINSAFSSTYDDYKIILTGIVPSATDSFRIKFGSMTANGYGSMYYDQYTGGATSTLRTNNAASNYLSLNQGSAGVTSTSFDVTGPNTTNYTNVYGMWYGRGFGGWATSTVMDSTQYTSFTILTDGAGTISGGMISVYGYRKA
jgi:hypothetical protein